MNCKLFLSNDQNEKEWRTGMIEFYNAFISYRHVPRDKKVAEEIQKELEHFKVPKEISEKTGITKIERIFRDKSELPISSNLTDDIKEALANSQYLIVICSNEALQSLWIKREIDLFLETHPQERVLTVLSEGDPEQVIPEALKYRKAVSKSALGKTITSLEPVEPLSCDYRMPFRKARREELPRLAATLLGCSYDELVQRANQYRMRRLRLTAAGVFAVSAAAVSYLIWSNNKIRENYEEAQRNMSLYLADVSTKALEDQDRISAIQNALDALPDEDHQRPVLAEAEYALAKATGVYDLPGDIQYSAVRRYEAENNIIDFLISPSEDSMVAVDQEGCLYIWNPGSSEPVYKEKINGVHSQLDIKIASGDDKGFYVSADNGISMRNWETGEVIWNREVSGLLNKFNLNSDHSMLSQVGLHKIYVFDSNGEIISEKDLYELEIDTPTMLQVDQEGKNALLIHELWNQSTTITLMDLETSELKVIGDEWKSIDYADFDEDGNILICELENSFGEIAGQWFNSFYTVGEMTENIYRINPSSGETIWQTAITFTQQGFKKVFETLEYSDENEILHKELICNTGNVQTIIDLEDGRILSQTQWPAAIMNVISKSGSRIISLLENGDRAINLRDSDLSTGAKAFVDGSKKAVVFKDDNKSESMMVLPDDKPYIIQYDSDLMPPDYRRLEYLNLYRIISAETAGDILAVDYRNADYEEFLSVYDQRTEEEILNYPLNDFDLNYYWNLSEDGESLYLVYSRDYKLTVKEVSLKTGIEDEFDLVSEENWSTDVYFELKNNLLYYGYPNPIDIPLAGGSSEEFPDFKCPLVTGIYDIHTGEYISRETEFMIDWNFLCDINKIVLSGDGRHCLLEIDNGKNWNERYELYLVTEEEAYHLDTSGQEHYCGVFNKSCSEVAVAYDDTIKVLDLHGEELAEIPYMGGSYLSMEYLEDELFLLTNEGIVYRYSSDHKLLGTYEVGVWLNSFYSRDKQYSWEIIDKTLYLKADGILSIADLDQSQSKAIIVNTLTYDLNKRNVLLTDSSGVTGGYSIIIVPIYSTEELVQTGRKILSE